MKEIYEEKGEVKLEDYEIVYQICDHPVLMTSPHYHNLIEIIYILEGEFVVTISDTKYILSPGEMVLINAKEVHSVHVLDYGIHRSFAVKFLPETICSDRSATFPGECGTNTTLDPARPPISFRVSMY